MTQLLNLIFYGLIISGAIYLILSGYNYFIGGKKEKTAYLFMSGIGGIALAFTLKYLF